MTISLRSSIRSWRGELGKKQLRFFKFEMFIKSSRGRRCLEERQDYRSLLD